MAKLRCTWNLRYAANCTGSKLSQCCAIVFLMRMSYRIRQYQLKKNHWEIFAIDVGNITLISKIDLFLMSWNFFSQHQIKIIFYKTIWELTSRPSIWAFIDCSRTFRSQDIYGSSKTFFFNWENCIFFLILKLYIAI